MIDTIHFSGLAETILLTQNQGFVYAFLQLKLCYCVSWKVHSATAFLSYWFNNCLALEWKQASAAGNFRKLSSGSC